MKTAVEIKALQIAAGTYTEPLETTEGTIPPLTFMDASDRYHRRQEDLRTRLRRYSSVSLLQRLELKQRAVAHMGGKCAVCGYCKCLRALEFHHIERQHKEFSISSFICTKVFDSSVEIVWESVVRELKKCRLLCSNCHREVEAGITDLPRTQ